MKIALNGATTMYADLETDIKAASAAGFDLIELWKSKLLKYLETHTVDDLKLALAGARLMPWSINSIEHISFRDDAEDYEKIKAECRLLAEIAKAIECPYIVVVPGKLPKNSTEDALIEGSKTALNDLADITEPFGVGLAFEFLGQTDCSVQTLDLAKRIVEQVDRNSVGLVIDSFHFYAGNSTFEAIDTLDPEKLFIFHINDAEDLPRETLTDAERLYPGKGILPLGEMKRRFDGIGYDRMVSIEIFRPEYWEQDPFEVARIAKESTERVLNIGRYAVRGSLGQ
ncbi:MAG TPA: sugar phosphate isomerase/epimerase [Pyrinomonadaceae bacterium]|nr:sugar phosphate isomerase/epimerase [Pyrinomonadaceae bacterium]